MREIVLTLVVSLLLTLNLLADERPNILFCIADDASYPHMGAYGCDWVNTPGFDQVAKAGLLFSRAYTPNAKCAPSRACILTGRNSWQLKAAVNHWCYFPPEFPTYAEVLATAGYQVGKTAKGWAPGIAKDEQGNRRQMTGKPYEKRRLQPPAKAINANDYAGNFEDFLNDNPEEKPWCFWYGSTEPHRAYEYQVGINKGGKQLAEIDEVPAFWPDTEVVRTDMLDYAFEIEYFDQHLVRMLNLLKERNELDNTIVVVTADNGMPFPRIKGQEYELSNHLPLAIMYPNGIKNPGRTVEDYVSFIDFAPTFIDYAGLDWTQTGMAPASGKSLRKVFEHTNVTPHRDHVLIGKERHDIGRPHDWGYPIRGIVKDQMLYLRNYEPERWPAGNPETGYLNTDGSPTKTSLLEANRRGEWTRLWKLNFGFRPNEELFNLAEDPYCLRNLANEPKWSTLKSALELQMVTELKEQGDLRMFGRGDVYEAYPYANAKERNFYGKSMSGEKLKAGWVNPTDFEEQGFEEKYESRD